MKEKGKGEETGAHLQLQKDKVSEGVQNQPSHSQKVSNIEKDSQPGTQHKGMYTIQTQPPKPKMLERRKKPIASQDAHTVVQSLSTSVERHM